MAKHKLTSLVASRLGNHRTRKDFLGQGSFPGLTIDALPTTPATGSNTITGQVAGLSQQLTALNALQQSEAQLDASTLVQHTANSSSGTSSIGSTLAGAASSVLGGLFGLTPILQGLFSLFGGSGPQTPAPLVPFTLPNSIQYAAGINGPGGSAVPVDYGQGGQVRSLSPAGASSTAPTATPASTIHVNVTAMDSQSFLDHSDDIAHAVRTAILNSHPINDVLSSL